jgi:hypothetical protein
MKLITLTNRKGTSNNFQSVNNFKCMFNNIVELPRNCQIALGGWMIEDGSAGTYDRVYVNLTNLPIRSVMGNNENGNVSTSSLMGFTAFGGSTNADMTSTLRFLDLDNVEPIKLSFIDVLMTNDVGVPTSTIKSTPNNTSVVLDIYYRQKPE